MRRTAILFSLLAACATPEPEEEPIPATRADVTAALQAQLSLVLQREAELRTATDPADVRERDRLRGMAADIVARLLYLDPDAELPRFGAEPEPESEAGSKAGSR